MPVNNAQRLARILLNIAESKDATIEQKLAATAQLVELTQPKKTRVGRPKKAVSTLLGSK